MAQAPLDEERRLSDDELWAIIKAQAVEFPEGHWLTKKGGSCQG
jgi:hypothetical protein